ncbi:MAG: hypothetical protein ABIH27_06915 [Candidatus Omnitrophota bacterium]
MKAILLFLILVYIGLFSSAVCADETINIMGVYIPIIAGAKPVKEGARLNPGIHVVAFEVSRPLNEVISYYHDFLIGNNFLLIGGEERDGFNAAVRKGESMFTVRIFSEVNKVIVQFVW